MKFNLEIKPAIPPEERRKIEDVLKDMGYDVSSGGTHTDMSACDISFRESESQHIKVDC